MVRHRCRLLEGAAEIGSNPGRPEAMVAELGGDIGAGRAAGGSSNRRLPAAEPSV